MGPGGPGGGGVVGLLVAIGECFGGFGMLVGFLARFSALANTAIMIGAIAMVHGKHGLLMQNGGFEYNLALMGLFLPIVILGPGRVSVSRLLPLKRNGLGITLE
jgi:putative oxidoreductase